jgi:FMN reductase
MLMPIRPFILGFGGTTRARSSSELVIRAALAEAERQGAEVVQVTGPDLVLPLYAPEDSARHPNAERLIELLRRSDGVIVASPGYHGSVSGLLKNAFDYIEDMARDARPYLDGKPFGTIACAYGWQATGSTLIALRTIAHALRAWPTPMGVAVNSTQTLFDESGACIDDALKANLSILVGQMLDFIRAHKAMRTTAAGDE